jgi:hypothetical protein
MLRKFFTAFLLSLAAFAVAETLSLDGAIGATAADVREAIPAHSKVAVVGIASPTERLSAYIADELSGALMASGSLVVVERKDLELVRDELKFQLSGDVDDESAQSVGKLLGAEVIVFGRFDESYRLRVKAVSVATAQILAVSAVDVERAGKAAFLAGAPGAELPAYGFDDPAAWSTFTDSSGSEGTDVILNVANERLEGKDYAVVTVEAEIPSKFRFSYAGWAAIPDEATLEKLKATKGIRFKVLGDGNRYDFRVHTAAVTDDDWYSASFATQKGKIVEVTIPYKRLHQAMQKGARFERSTITGISFLTRKSTASAIKFFDIRPY